MNLEEVKKLRDEEVQGFVMIDKADEGCERIKDFESSSSSKINFEDKEDRFQRIREV